MRPSPSCVWRWIRQDSKRLIRLLTSTARLWTGLCAVRVRGQAMHNPNPPTGRRPKPPAPPPPRSEPFRDWCNCHECKADSFGFTRKTPATVEFVKQTPTGDDAVYLIPLIILCVSFGMAIGKYLL